MKKLLLTITLAAALFTAGINAEITETTLVWVGDGWIVVNSTDGDDPLPPVPPIIK